MASVQPGASTSFAGSVQWCARNCQRSAPPCSSCTVIGIDPSTLAALERSHIDWSAVRLCSWSCCLGAATRSLSTLTATVSTMTSSSGSSASFQRLGKPRPRDDESAGIASGFQQPCGDVGVEDRVRQGALIEIAMTLRRVALHYRGTLARSVTCHVTTARTAKHRGGHALPRVLAVREAHVAATFGAAPARLGLARRIDAHRDKRTALTGRTAGTTAG